MVRLSFVEGDVAYQRAGATWQRAMMNQPIQQDFSLRTDAGYAEVEFETGLVIRLAQNTQMDFTELSMIDGRKVTRLKLDEGTIITTANLSHNDELSVAAGNVDVTVPRNGRFRVDATESQNWVTVFHGKVEVASGQTTKEVESGKTLHAGGASSALSVDASPEADAFDKWVTDRDKAEQNFAIKREPICLAAKLFVQRGLIFITTGSGTTCRVTEWCGSRMEWAQAGCRLAMGRG